LGASLAAFGAGALRTSLGDYNLSFYLAGALCICAGLSFLTLGRRIFREREVQFNLELRPVPAA
jgi:hypothetical protein